MSTPSNSSMAIKSKTRSCGNKGNAKSAQASFSFIVSPFEIESLVDFILQLRHLPAKFPLSFMLQPLEVDIIKNRRHDRQAVVVSGRVLYHPTHCGHQTVVLL